MTATLLVDLDGTLTDNYPGISRSVSYALERMGRGAPAAEELRKCVGPPLRTSLARLLATEDRETIERALALYRERYRDLGWRENIVYDGIFAALPRLAQHASRMFVCTSKPDVFAQKIVAEFGLRGYFTGVYGTDLEGSLDDKAMLVAHVARREGIALERAVMIGDREHDVRAAHRNGARAIGVLWGYGTREELREADAIAATPQDLAAALEHLLAG